MPFTNPRIVALTFPDRFAEGHAPIGHIDLFPADPIAWKFDLNNPDDVELLTWLNANTPGWSLKLHPGPAAPVDFDMEGQPVLMLQEWSMTIHFVSAAHRAAYRAYRHTLDAVAAAHSAYVSQRIADAPDDANVCDECGAILEPREKEDMFRIAQFGLRYTLKYLACPECSEIIHFAHPEMHTMHEATNAIVARIGLPHFGHPLWSEKTTEELIHRRNAPPEIVIDVTPESTVESLLSDLDAQLTASGRPPRSVTPILQCISATKPPHRSSR